jgi:hypothetical protein
VLKKGMSREYTVVRLHDCRWNLQPKRNPSKLSSLRATCFAYLNSNL